LCRQCTKYVEMETNPRQGPTWLPKAEISIPCPPILYHGTSMTRWESIKKNGLQSNTPSIYPDHLEYIPKNYLTCNMYDAGGYAMKTVLMEKELPEEKKQILDINNEIPVGAIVMINIAGLIDNNPSLSYSLLPDPEDHFDIGWFVFTEDIPPEFLGPEPQPIEFEKQPKDFQKTLIHDLRLSEVIERTGDPKKIVDEIVKGYTDPDVLNYLGMTSPNEAMQPELNRLKTRFPDLYPKILTLLKEKFPN